MPFRITQESYRPRVSDRTMVGTLPARSACKFQEPNGVDNGSCHETVAMGTTRSDAPQRKAVQTKRQPARGRAGCARNSTASGEGRKMSLDIPFYRTLRSEKPSRRRGNPRGGRAGCARNSTASGEGRKKTLDIPFYRTFPQLRRLRVYE